MSADIRIYLTGACDGFDKLRDALGQLPGLEIVGASEHVSAAVAALSGGHLDCILHGTASPTLPVHDLAAIREQSRVPILVVASGESSALLDEALERGRRRRRCCCRS